MSILIWRGDRPSRSAQELKKALRNKGLRAFVNRRSAVTVGRRCSMIVNWGRSDCHESTPARPVLNSRNAVHNAQCKLRAYRAMETAGVPLPAYTNDQRVAADWLASGKFRRVVARCTTTGSEGRGIVICKAGEFHPGAPLYVEYVPKKYEYRIHVGQAGAHQVLDVQQKRKRRDMPNDHVDYEVRNSCNGWVFCREDIVQPPQAAFDAAIAAVQALGLTFGAVDLGVTEKSGRVCVYEVNTAPGLEGSTLETYADYIAGLTRC